MIRRKFPTFLTAAAALAGPDLGIRPGLGRTEDPKPRNKVEAKRLEQQAIRAAAKAARARGQKPGIAALAAPGALAVQAPDPGGVPHYSGRTATGRSARYRRGPSGPSPFCTGALDTAPHLRSPLTTRTFRRRRSPPLM